jgi:DNA-binding GntR family transcriptional regulator
MENPLATAIDKDDALGPLSDIVFQRMLEAIYQERLAPGSVVNEAALAGEFGVSRGPVREAVRRLQGIQLITREPYMKARVVELTAQTAIELFQMRMALEGVACSLAARRMKDAEIEQLCDDLEQDRKARANPSASTAQPRVFDFHERVVRACGNARIISALCEDLYHLLRVYRRHSGTVLERKEDAYEEHWQILRAISSRDSKLAESLMRSHINRAANHLFEHLKDGDGTSLHLIQD